MDVVYRINSDGSDLRAVARVPIERAHRSYTYLPAPSWAPDGTRVAFGVNNSKYVGCLWCCGVCCVCVCVCVVACVWCVCVDCMYVWVFVCTIHWNLNSIECDYMARYCLLARLLTLKAGYDTLYKDVFPLLARADLYTMYTCTKDVLPCWPGLCLQYTLYQGVFPC